MTKKAQAKIRKKVTAKKSKKRPAKEAVIERSDKNPVGHPLKFQDVEELQISIGLYFDWCDKEYDSRKWCHDEIDIESDGKRRCLNCYQTLPSRGCMLLSGELKEKKPYTVTGLALWLDTTRRTLLDYQLKDRFTHTITRAKQRIENFAEECLYDPSKPTKGVIFSLSNNSEGWTDKATVTQVGIADLIKSQEASTQR